MAGATSASLVITALDATDAANTSAQRMEGPPAHFTFNEVMPGIFVFSTRPSKYSALRPVHTPLAG